MAFILTLAVVIKNGDNYDTIWLSILSAEKNQPLGLPISKIHKIWKVFIYYWVLKLKVSYKNDSNRWKMGWDKKNRFVECPHVIALWHVTFVILLIFTIGTDSRKVSLICSRSQSSFKPKCIWLHANREKKVTDTGWWGMDNFKEKNKHGGRLMPALSLRIYWEKVVKVRRQERLQWDVRSPHLYCTAVSSHSSSLVILSTKIDRIQLAVSN